MQRVEQIEGNLDRHMLRVGKLGPGGFVVRLDGRLILGQRQLEARVCVQVAVGDVMHELASPSSLRDGTGSRAGRG